MGKRRAIVLGGVLALAALAPTASAQQQSQEQEIGLLFAQTANRGTMKPIQGPTPRFNLKLRGVNSQVVWFSDRPARQSGHIPVPEFTRSWAGFGFVDDPPNAALTLLQAGDSQDTVVMELGRPHFKKKKNAIRYSAQLLDEATGNLSYLNSDLDPRVNRRFRAPSLFIDDATARVINGCRIAPHTLCPGANLRGAKLIGEDLSFANLYKADLIAADLRRGSLYYADLREAQLGGAILASVDLAGANLSGAIGRGVGLSDAELLGANMSGADLSFSDLSFANLIKANLTKATLSPADLHNVFLHEATGRDANLSGANLSGADLGERGRTCTGGSCSGGLDAANLRGANLSRAKLIGANLFKVNLTEADLRGADLTGAVLAGVLFCRTTMPDGSINNRNCGEHGTR